MTLAAPLTALATRLHGITADAQADLRGVLDHFAEVRTSIDQHFGDLLGSPVLQAYEVNALDGAAEKLIADLIHRIGTPRPELPAGAQIPDGAESPQEAPGAASDTPIADEALAALSGAPVVGGTAS